MFAADYSGGFVYIMIVSASKSQIDITRSIPIAPDSSVFPFAYFEIVTP